jgi:hypothetical protein
LPHRRLPGKDEKISAMSKFLCLLLILGIAGWFFLRDTSLPAPEPGVRIVSVPEQTPTSRQKWTEKGYEVRPLARYSIKARVLSRKRYFFDDTADISPLDLALGWGNMSDSAVLNHISVSQSGRWYEYYYQPDCPASPKAIATQSANVHCLPADSSVWKDLRNLRVNSFVELKGFLVEVQKDGAPPWTSSLVRDDQGAGACEILWVTDVRELNP